MENSNLIEDPVLAVDVFMVSFVCIIYRVEEDLAVCSSYHHFWSFSATWATISTDPRRT